MRKLSILLLGFAVVLGLAFAQTGGVTGGSTGGATGGLTEDSDTGGAMTGGTMDSTGGATGGSTGSMMDATGGTTGGATGGSETGGVSLAEESGSVADIVSSDPQFSILLQALSAAGLAEELASGGPYTVLAPTNDAFNALPSGELDTLLSNPAQLADILQNHVISGEYGSSQLAGLPAALALTGNELSIQSDGSGGLTVGGANVESADIQATNGIIHVIDSVILPSSTDGPDGRAAQVVAPGAAPRAAATTTATNRI